MKVYLTGGGVRDMLLGIPPRDKDYVVTETTAEELIQLGFQEIGKSHTIYLHPNTREEYTIADSLEADLLRRDLTINALAIEDGKILDFSGGVSDLRNKILRHVREENFFYDPLRVYRTAVMKARLPEFEVHFETIRLMQLVAKERRFLEISGERIFREIERTLCTPNPEEFFFLLRKIGILSVHFQFLDEQREESFSETMNVLSEVSCQTNETSVRFASLFISVRSSVDSFFERVLVPHSWEESARLVSIFFPEAMGLRQQPPAQVIDFLYRTDGFRKPHLIQLLSSLLQWSNRQSSALYLAEVFHIVRGVTSKDVEASARGPLLGEAIRRERISRLERARNGEVSKDKDL